MNLLLLDFVQGSSSGRSTQGRRASLPPSSRGTTPLARLTPVPEDVSMADEQSARRAWDPSHQSATVERHVKIRACLDLATVLLRVPSAYRGVLSDLFAKYTDKVEQRDVLEGPLQVAVRWAESVGTRLVTSQWRHIQIVPERPKGWTTPLVAFASRWAIRVGAGSWLRPHTEPPC